MKIVSVDTFHFYPGDKKILEHQREVVEHTDVPTEEMGRNRIADAEIVIIKWFNMPASVISAFPKLKLICTATVGYNHIDLKAAKRQGVIVVNCPEYATEAVAELTIGLLINAARLASTSERAVRVGKYDPQKFIGKELTGKTLGIIGMGKIGTRVAYIAQRGFSMKILSVNSNSTRQDLEKLLRVSDFISINAPLTDKTAKLLGSQEFSLMKDGVVLVNTARGPLIDEVALIKALKSRKVFAVGLDVLSKEPMDPQDHLLTLPNVVVTSHIGWNTEESARKLSKEVTENIIAFLDGKPRNVVS